MKFVKVASSPSLSRTFSESGFTNYGTEGKGELKNE